MRDKYVDIPSLDSMTRAFSREKQRDDFERILGGQQYHILFCIVIVPHFIFSTFVINSTSTRGGSRLLLVDELIVLSHLFLREAFLCHGVSSQVVLISSINRKYEKTKSKENYKRGTDIKLAQSGSNMRKDATVSKHL